MTSLPSVSSLECVRALLKLGFSIRRQLHGAVSLEKPGRIVVVPLGRTLHEDGLALILLAACVTREQFVGALAPGAASGEHSLDLAGRKDKPKIA